MRGAHGRHVDDVSALPLFQEYLDGFAHRRHGTVDIDIHDLAELLVTCLGNGGHVTHDTGIVDQNIQSAIGGNGSIDHAFAVFPPGYIPCIDLHLSGIVLQALCQGFQAFLPSGHRNDIRAFFDEQFHNGFSHPGGCARHDNGFVFEFHVLISFPIC